MTLQGRAAVTPRGCAVVTPQGKAVVTPQGKAGVTLEPVGTGASGWEGTCIVTQPVTEMELEEQLLQEENYSSADNWVGTIISYPPSCSQDRMQTFLKRRAVVGQPTEGRKNRYLTGVAMRALRSDENDRSRGRPRSRRKESRKALCPLGLLQAPAVWNCVFSRRRVLCLR